jgi:hypothetical protein
MLALKSNVTFPALFFSLSLHQQFNRKGWEFASDEDESALRKYVKAINWH